MRPTRLLPLVLLLLLPLAIPTPGALAQGNSENAKACRHEGYLDWTDDTGAGFRNAGQCTSYAARGGNLYPVASLHVVWAREGSFRGAPPSDGSLIGRGLEPGAPIYFRARGHSGEQWFTVDPDGTINAVLEYPEKNVCAIADPHLSTTTRTDEVIRTHEYPEPPCHKDEWL